MRTILLLLFGLFSGLSFGQNRQKDLAAFERQYILDSIVSHGQRYLDRYPQRTAERNKIVSGVLNAQIRRGDFSQAHTLYESELPRISDSVQRAFLYREYALLSNYEEAIDQAELYLIRAMKIMQRAGNRTGEAIVLTDLAELSRKTMTYEEGFEYIRRAKKAVADGEIRDPRLLAQLYNREAALLNQTGKNEASVDVSKKALAYAEQAGDYHLQAVSWNEIGYGYGNFLNWGAAQKAYEKAEDLWITAGMYQDATLVKFNLIEGMTHRAIVDNRESNLRYVKLLEFIELHGVKFARERIYSHMMRNYAVLKDYENAYKYSRLHNDNERQSWEAQSRKDFDRIREEFRNDLLQKEAETAQQQLKGSQQLVARKQLENTIAVIAAVILGLLLAVIALLYYRTRRDKRTLQREAKIKDSLIQEIHHRVKNNLQFVSSLMNMQMNASSNDTEIYALNDASRRIKSMALVHEMLYNYDDNQTVSLKKYIEELIETLKDLSSAQEQSVRFVTRVTDIQVTVGQSVALGMISSELVSNALKYAFAGVSDPCIELTVDVDKEGLCHFALRDNGPGLRESETNVPNLGMRLVDIFSRQLKGDYRFANDEGLVFRLEFNP